MATVTAETWTSIITVSTSKPSGFVVNYTLLAPLILLILFTCAANIVVILCVRTYRPLQKPNNYFVISLAVADALVGLVVMSGMLVYTVYGLWPLSDHLCTIWVVADFSSCTVSMIHLCVIAHDRHLALAKPLQYRQSNRSKVITIYILLTWIVGILAWLPAIIWFRVSQEPIEKDCLFVPSKHYTLVQSLLVYYLPVVLMLVFYAQCVYGLQKQYRKINAALGHGTPNENAAKPDGLSAPVEDNASSYVDAPSTTGHTSTEVTTVVKTVSSVQSSGTIRHQVRTKERRRQEHTKSIRTLGVIIVIFMICWMPFCIFWPVKAFCEKCIPAKWYEYSYWSAYLNSTINPLLYFLSNKDFRNALKKLLDGKKRKK